MYLSLSHTYMYHTRACTSTHTNTSTHAQAHTSTHTHTRKHAHTLSWAHALVHAGLRSAYTAVAKRLPLRVPRGHGAGARPHLRGAGVCRSMQYACICMTRIAPWNVCSSLHCLCQSTQPVVTVRKPHPSRMLAGTCQRRLRQGPPTNTCCCLTLCRAYTHCFTPLPRAFALPHSSAMRVPCRACSYLPHRTLWVMRLPQSALKPSSTRCVRANV